MAVRWALGRLDEMRPAQRRAVLGALARLGPPDGNQAHAAADDDWVANPSDQALADKAANDIAALLGIGLTLKLRVGRGTIDGTGDMVTFPDPGSTAMKDCIITIGAGGLQYLTDPAAYLTLLTHEVFHCFQLQIGGFAAYSATHLDGKLKVQDRNWMYEGGAHWAACEIAPNPETSYIAEATDAFITTPEQPLFEREYNAIGLWRLLTARGVDLWSRWPAILKASGDAATFNAIGADPAYDTWASFAMRKPQFGPDWDLPKTRCMSRTAAKAPTIPFALVDGQKVYVSAPPYTAADYELRSSADVVTFEMDAHARLGAEDIDNKGLATSPTAATPTAAAVLPRPARSPRRRHSGKRPRPSC